MPPKQMQNDPALHPEENKEEEFSLSAGDTGLVTRNKYGITVAGTRLDPVIQAAYDKEVGVESNLQECLERFNRKAEMLDKAEKAARVIREKWLINRWPGSKNIATNRFSQEIGTEKPRKSSSRMTLHCQRQRTKIWDNAGSRSIV